MKFEKLLIAAALLIVAIGCSSGSDGSQSAKVEGAPATSTPKAAIDPQNVRRPPDPAEMRRQFEQNAAKGGPPPAPGGM